MDTIIAVRLTLDTGEDRFFLTWGRLGRHVPWPGDIERALLRAATRYSLGGTPVDARVCDSLQEASGQRYFYECLVAMQGRMPATTDAAWEQWAADMTAAVLRGEQLLYCGRPSTLDPMPDPAARHGFTLEWFDGDDLAGSQNLYGLSAERLQHLLGDEDIDRVLCLTPAVSGDVLALLAGEYGIEVDPARYRYYVSPWADPGFRTPRGYAPPPVKP